jgi:argininosuccinate lyase
MSKILRGGRLPPIREDVIKFTSSIKDDIRLAKAVIDINKAHVIMLLEQKIINQADGSKLLQALNAKLNLKMESSSEDVHMAVEEAVLEETGPEVGGNLHIAKSRNDQVTTAIRMELRESLLDIIEAIVTFQENLAETAGKHVKTVILEYTHLQPAQPVTFAHYLLSRFDALDRDLQRLQDAYVRVNLCPMGAGALATTSFPINRERVAELLGFNGLVENSIDAVGSRDFILETIATLTIVAVNLSQFAEDLIVWSSLDFGIVEIPDDFTSTSSMMPQKKNPEVPEVIRARASNVLGDFVGAAAAMKSMPSTYNLDFQEVTPKLWASIENVAASLKMFAALVPNLKVAGDVSAKAMLSFVAATELANLLVREYKVPFRAAHKIVGAFVKTLLQAKKTFADATPEMLGKIAKETSRIELNINAKQLAELADPMKIIQSHKVKGGPAPNEVRRALATRRKIVLLSKSNINRMKKQLEEADQKLRSKSKSMSNADSLENGRFKNEKL